MRKVQNFDDVNAALQELWDWKDLWKTKDIDLHGRRFKNVGKHVDSTDFVRWDELPDFKQIPGTTIRRGGGGGNLDKIIFGFGINSSIVVASDVCPHEPFTENSTILNVRALMKNGPTGSDVIFDCKQNGITSIFNSPIHVMNGQIRSSTIVSFAISAMNEDDYLTLDVTQIGSVQAGTDLVIVVRYGPR